MNDVTVAQDGSLKTTPRKPSSPKPEEIEEDDEKCLIDKEDSLVEEKDDENSDEATDDVKIIENETSHVNGDAPGIAQFMSKCDHFLTLSPYLDSVS